MPRHSNFLSIDFLCLLVFALLAVNFATPTLSFLAYMSDSTPMVFSYINQLLSALPFIIAAIFFYILFNKISTLEKRTVLSLSSLQAVLAFVIFIMWLDKNYFRFSGRLAFPFNFVADVLPIILVIVLYTAWILVISGEGRNRLNLSSRFETLYLAINLVFALSFSLHLFKSVDFFYYFGFRLPSSVSWIFAYAPTLLVSFMSLIVWASFVLGVRKLRKLTLHLMLVLLPVFFVLYAIILRPLVGYVLTSAIVWGSSYEFFYPPTLSLSLILLATTAFISSSILLGPLSVDRKPNVIRFSSASAVLAGMSLSPLSILGILLSLQFLFLGIKPRKN